MEPEPPPSRRAIILFAHGARDPTWATALHQLVERLREQLPQAHVSVAFLELQAPTLEAALEDACRRNCTALDVVPVFWAAGGHVANDLPPLLDAFRQSHRGITIRLLPTLSELPGMLDFIANAVVGYQSP